MVILPISWRARKDEAGEVLRYANEVKGMLEANGLRAFVDASDKHTPGKKMEYWEQLGVKVQQAPSPSAATHPSATPPMARPGALRLPCPWPPRAGRSADAFPLRL